MPDAARLFVMVHLDGLSTGSQSNAELYFCRRTDLQVRLLTDAPKMVLDGPGDPSYPRSLANWIADLRRERDYTAPV
jgi:hypothetical protein